jgi:hypothetical protein
MSSGVRKILGGSVVALALLTAACGSDNPAEPGSAPALPPLGSMQADVSLFDAGGAAVSESAAAATAESNFLTAALAVSVAKAATVLVMAVPVATFAAAASNTPVFEDNAFHWRYSVSQNGQTFMADLSGIGEGTESVWEMHVSATGATPPLSNYLWYTGRAQLDGTSGVWHIFDASQASSTEVLQIDWTHPAATDWTLTFTDVNPPSLTHNDQLDYESHGDQRVASYFDASAGATTEILWNASTHEGSIQAPGYNGGLKSCWDASLANVTCAG